MVRITKVYTKTGDKGQTGLAGNIRLSKTSPRIHAIGDVDELNASIGLIISTFPKQKKLLALKNQLFRIQNELFNLGAQLAVLPTKRRSNTPKIDNIDVQRLEKEMDDMNTTLPYLNSFILPGGHPVAALFHITRTICRRAERSIIALNNKEKLDKVMVPYLNRLSDWLFVAARFVNLHTKQKEILWAS
jgi:cob(I)alamin adenosyltransferase